MDTSIIALRQAYLMDTLGPFIVRNNSTNDWALFEDPTTPQAKALQWMVAEDTFSSDPTSMEFQTLLERYALAVIGVSTNLYEMSSRLDLHFMDPTRSVCDWKGRLNHVYYEFVSCGDNETVIEFELSGLPVTGTIPWKISLLENLTEITWRATRSTGTVPPELGTLTALSYLSLAENQLSGTIPSELMGPSIQVLNLNWNKLTGTFPTEIGLLPQNTKVIISLSTNDLSGTLPSEIAQLTGLYTLDVANNPRVAGTVPGSLHFLLQFWADNTSLTGSLDAMFCPEGSTFREGYEFDCLGPEPEIECSCCFRCCDADGDNCENAYLTWTTRAPHGGASIVQNPFWLLQLLVHGLLSLWMFIL